MGSFAVRECLSKQAAMVNSLSCRPPPRLPLVLKCAHAASKYAGNMHLPHTHQTETWSRGERGVFTVFDQATGFGGWHLYVVHTTSSKVVWFPDQSLINLNDISKIVGFRNPTTLMAACIQLHWHPAITPFYERRAADADAAAESALNADAFNSIVGNREHQWICTNKSKCRKMMNSGEDYPVLAV